MSPRTLLIVCVTALLCVGCVTVQPWQRERLAQTDMQFGGAEEIHSAESHATEVREGSAGGFDASGGGCGCN